MRKLTKKISMLMVLAMLVGLFSGVVSASAASAWSFKSGKYNVAVGGEINMKKNEYADFDLLKDGKAPTGYTVEWASSDEDVVWVNAKTGQLRADKAKKAEDGDKAVISATFTNTATKKNATRSFTIVIGEAKAPVYTVECADVTAVLGDAIKFAPVVKNAAGEVVKFATHKSYNGYFLDGKAITNPWTPEEAGEYTVTVAQFAAKADVADLAKAVRKIDVKVTVKADLAAEATGVKEITVYGDFAKDAKFTVKKDGVQNVSVTAAVAEDGKSATLALKNKLTKGVYTVSCAGASVDVVTEDEKVDQIVILEKDGVVLTDGANSVYVHYDVLNQYGESVRKTFDVSWSHNLDSENVDRTNGIVTLTSGDELRYNDVIVLTGVASGFGFAESETATMHVGLEQSIDSVKVLGIMKEDDPKLINEIPASFIGGNYRLVFEAYDACGYIIKLRNDDTRLGDLRFISMNPLLVELDEDTLDTVSIDGNVYGVVDIEKGKLDEQVRKGGVADIRITSTKTGKNTPYDLRVVSEQILSEFKLYAPEDLVIKTAANGGYTTVAIPYQAVDTNGDVITDYRAMYEAVSFTDDRVTLSENNDGTASLTFSIDARIRPTDNSDDQVMFNAIVAGTGKMSSVKFNVKVERYAAAVSDLVEQSASAYILEGNTITIDLIKNRSNGGNALRLEFIDQYDEKVDSLNLFGITEEKKGQYIGVKAIEDGVINVVTSSANYVGNVDGYELFETKDVDGYKNIQLTAASNCTDAIKACDVEFALFDTDMEIVSASDKRFTFYAVDINEVASFSLYLDWHSAIKYNDHTFTPSMSAVLKKTGKKVAVQNSTSEYTVTYNGQGGVFTGAAITVAYKPVLKEDKTTDVFLDFSKPTQDMDVYAGRNQKFDVTAVVMKGDNYVGEAKNSIDVSNNGRWAATIVTKGWVAGWFSWTNGNTAATIKADRGTITKADIIAAIDKVNDNYSDWYAAGDAVDLKISNLVENENGFNFDGKLTETAGTITNAEIGDTFVATYSYNGVVHVINFTVGSDREAKIVGDDAASVYR